MNLYPADPGWRARGLRGGVAGAAATLPMSLLMLAAQKAGLMGKQPPEKITEAALDEAADEPVDEAVDEPVQDALAVVNHFAFGAAAGALFGIVRREEMPALAQGIAFGLAVWTVSYKGWVPAFNIMPPPQQDRRGRPASMIAAHIVFGGVLGALVERFDAD